MTKKLFSRIISHQKYIEHSAFKTIAAFLNSDGGTLFIGVDDNGEILDLDNDFNSFKGTNKKDEFLKHFNLIQDFFGNNFTRNFEVSFPMIDGKIIAIVEVKEKASEPIILHNKEKNKEEFFIRRLASTASLTMYETIQYIKDHWKD